MIPSLERIIPSEITLLSLIIIIIGLVILWIIVSIPMYIAGKVVTSGKSTIGDAMASALLEPIVLYHSIGRSGLPSRRNHRERSLHLGLYPTVHSLDLGLQIHL